jgi:hypothetical protein
MNDEWQLFQMIDYQSIKIVIIHHLSLIIPY